MTTVFVSGSLPAEIDLKIPGGTYQATPTFIAVDRAGQWFVTSMSNYGVPKGQFGIHLWYSKKLGNPWNMIRFRDKCHGNLTLIGNQLYFFTNEVGGATKGSVVIQWLGMIPQSE